MNHWGGSILVLLSLLLLLSLYVMFEKSRLRTLIFPLLLGGGLPALAIWAEALLLPWGRHLGGAPWLGAFLVAFVEEGIKFLAIRGSFKTQRSPSPGATALAIGLSFALVETLLYSLGSQSPHVTLRLRLISSLPLHLICAMHLSLGLPFSDYQQTLKGILTALLLHTLYNSILHHPRIPDPFAYAIPIVGLILYFLHKKMRFLKKETF
ncbi:MAG: PrsW family intramembrane metalloprotease [Spirochaetales bacterium]|nr:PrsW family intramembrane metalloprotease [Spirochaetales bacterium]